MDKVIELIKKAKKAVLLPHISADADALASCQAMRLALNGMGIDATIYAEEKIEQRLDFISDGIKIFDGEIPDFDTCIMLDCGDMDRAGDRKVFAESAQCVINIDHHKTNTRYGDANCVFDEASATGEVLFSLFGDMGVEITDEIAKYLFTAICSDTGGFAFSNVSPKTFRIAAQLIEHNFNHAEVSRLLFDCVDIDSELLKAEMTKKINSYYGGKVRTVAVTHEFARGFGLDTKEIDGIVDIPRRIRGTEVAVALKEVNGKIRISLRSNGDSDVSKVALKFNGGGHIKAAGCSIENTDIEEAERLVVEACKDVI